MIRDSDATKQAVAEIVAANTQAVADYRAGKTKADSVYEGIMTAIAKEKAVTYVLINYTALISTQKILRKLVRGRY